jgi:hypothetical protein
MMGIGYNKWAVDDQITAAFGIIKEKTVYQNIRTRIRVFATADFKHETLLGWVESLFHTT